MNSVEKENQSKIIKINFNKIKEYINQIESYEWKNIFLQEFSKFENSNDELKYTSILELQEGFESFKNSMNSDEDDPCPDLEYAQAIEDYIGELLAENIAENNKDIVSFSTEAVLTELKETSDALDKKEEIQHDYSGLDAANNYPVSSAIAESEKENQQDDLGENLDVQQQLSNTSNNELVNQKKEIQSISEESLKNLKDEIKSLMEIVQKRIIENANEINEKQAVSLIEKLDFIKSNVEQLASNDTALNKNIETKLNEFKELIKSIDDANNSKIDTLINDLKSSFSEIITKSVEDNKLKIELNSKQNNIILACGVSSLIMSFVALFLMISGINWYQDHARYQIVSDVITKLDPTDKAIYESWFKKYDDSKNN